MWVNCDLDVLNSTIIITQMCIHHQATTAVKFLVVDAPFAFNILLGRPSLNAIMVIPSAYHMMIKFPTTIGVGMVRGDQCNDPYQIIQVFNTFD